jgi:ribosome biogenesis GTPase
MLGVSEGLEDAFADIGELAKRCRFKDCSHSSEPGCAVRAAIEQQDLSEQRLQDYLKLRKEAAFHDLSYVDRCKKDRDFGRIVRSVLKNKGKRCEY